MSRRVAILTPDPADRDFRSRWRDVFAEEAAVLERAGLAVAGRAWTQSDDFPSFDLAGRGVRLQNPAAVLAWNVDKTYLGRLAGRGAPVVPTRYVDRVSETALAEAAAAFGTDALIAKPQISASAWQTIRWSPGTPLDGGPDGPAMIQPFLPAILDEGEISLVYVGGAYNHALRKRPRPGDFRVQPEHDGIITAHDASADERAAAEAVLAAVAEPLLYARIDMTRDSAGAPQLMELELVEPDLYFEHDPARGAAFAAAVAATARA
jgi:hypothetical protein